MAQSKRKQKLTDADIIHAAILVRRTTREESIAAWEVEKKAVEEAYEAALLKAVMGTRMGKKIAATFPGFTCNSLHTWNIPHISWYWDGSKGDSGDQDARGDVRITKASAKSLKKLKSKVEALENLIHQTRKMNELAWKRKMLEDVLKLHPKELAKVRSIIEKCVVAENRKGQL